MAIGAIAAGLIAGGMQTGGGILGNVLTNQANKKLAAYSYGQEQKMIDAQNLYNSPAEQMKRYEAAGLNPNMIYENGSASAGNQNQIARYSAPRMDYNVDIPNALDNINKFQDFQVKQANTDVIKAEANIRNIKAQWTGRMLEAEWFDKYSKGMISKSDYLRKSMQLGLDFGFVPESVDSRDGSAQYDTGTYSKMKAIYQNQKAKTLEKTQSDVLNRNINNQLLELQKKWFKFNQLKGLAGDLIGVGGKALTKSVINNTRNITFPRY